MRGHLPSIGLPGVVAASGTIAANNSLVDLPEHPIESDGSIEVEEIGTTALKIKNIVRFSCRI